MFDLCQGMALRFSQFLINIVWSCLILYCMNLDGLMQLVTTRGREICPGYFGEVLINQSNKITCLPSIGTIQLCTFFVHVLINSLFSFYFFNEYCLEHPIK